MKIIYRYQVLGVTCVLLLNVMEWNRTPDVTSQHLKWFALHNNQIRSLGE